MAIFSESLTYAQLAAKIANSTLSKCKSYTIVDCECVPGLIEPLLVTALSKNELKPEAYSRLAPDDIIYYNPTSSVEHPTGFITRRVNTTLPTEQVQPDWNATSGMAQILNKPSSTFYRIMTHAELMVEISNSTLVTGESIEISDHATMHNIQSGSSFLPEVHTGITEPLRVFAISSDTLDFRATSALFPKDYIEYDALDILCEDEITARKGKITFRKDHLGNETYYDFRGVIFRRWKADLSSYPVWIINTPYTAGTLLVHNSNLYYCLYDIANSNISPLIDEEGFVWVCDSIEYWAIGGGVMVYGGDPITQTDLFVPISSTYKDYYTFSNANGEQKSEYFSRIRISKNVKYNSIVLIEDNYNQSYNTVFEERCNSMHFLGTVSNNVFGADTSMIMAKKTIRRNIFGSNVTRLILGSDFLSNKIGDSSYGCIFGNGVSFNNIKSINMSILNFLSSNLEFGDNNRYVITSFARDCTVGTYNEVLILQRNTTLVTIGSYNFYTIIKPDCLDIEIGNQNNEITIGEANKSVKIGSFNQSIETDREGMNIVFGNRINVAHTGEYSEHCVFGDYTKNLDLSMLTVKQNVFKEKMDFNGVNFASATHLIGSYFCEIIKRLDGTARLKYLNNSDVEVITDANA